MTVVARLVRATGCLLAALAAHVSAQDPSVRDERTDFVDLFCVTCHGATDPEAGFRIDTTSYDLSDSAARDRWGEIMEYVKHGDMPPSSAGFFPEEEEIERFLAVVEADMEAAAVAPPSGVAAFRRMTRSEHITTLIDLFDIRGLRLPVTFPEEVSTYEFDSMAEGLFLSTAHLDASFRLAADVADRVLPLPTPTPVSVVIPRDQWRNGWIKKGDPHAFHFTGLNSERGGALSGKGFVAREPGVYEVRVRGNAEGRAGIDGKPLRLGFYAIERAMYTYPEREDRHNLPRVAVYDVTNLEPEDLVFEVMLEPGESFQIYCENRIHEEYPERGIRRAELWALVLAAKSNPRPTVRVESMEVVGPIRPLPRQTRVLRDSEPLADEGYVRAVLLPLARRAYRRPLSASEERALIRMVMAHMADAETPSHAIHFGIRRLLTAPQFLFLNANPDSRDSFGLASRLSYFLWGSMPDDELFALSNDGRLSSTDVLRRQVRRMIADPKSSRFMESFTGQWLSNRDAASVMVCDVKHTWSELIHYGYLRSTELFFEEILQQNLSIRTFIDSDFTYANEPMRIAWGFPGDYPSWVRLEDRRIQSSLWPEPERLDLTALEPGVPDHVSTRGGVLGLPSMLMATGDGVESSPILRGVWILENLFGTPTPPPPDDVPAIVPDLTKAQTVREILVAHQASDSCARCHVKIDPLGMAMEHYDAMGSWRTEYNVKLVDERGAEQVTTMPLETTSTLLDGTQVSGPGDIKAYLLRHPEMFTRCLATKLAEYATGRELTAGDERVLDEIVASEPVDGYGFQDLILAIVESEIFLASAPQSSAPSTGTPGAR